MYRYVTQANPPTECPVGSEHEVCINRVSIVDSDIAEYSKEWYIVYETGETIDTIEEVEDYIENNPRDRVIPSLLSSVEWIEENHDQDYVIYDLISDEKHKRNKTVAPQDVDYNILWFKKERIFEQWFLKTVKYWKDYDEVTETYSGLAVQEDNVYHRDPAGINKLIKRVKSIKWYTNNIEPITEKITTKYYTMLEWAHADYRARTYIVDDVKYKAIWLVMATEQVDELTAFGMGMPFVSGLSSQMQQFRDWDRQSLIDAVNADVTYAWLDNDTWISDLQWGTFTIRTYVVDLISV